MTNDQWANIYFTGYFKKQKSVLWTSAYVCVCACVCMHPDKGLPTVIVNDTGTCQTKSQSITLYMFLCFDLFFVVIVRFIFGK